MTEETGKVTGKANVFTQWWNDVDTDEDGEGGKRSGQILGIFWR